MPRYVVPDTVEQALELLDSGLLYRNSSVSIPRNATLWALCHTMEELKHSIRTAYEEKESIPTSVKWCRDDFAYVLED